MSIPTRPTGLIAISWLFLLHGLADVAVGLSRCLQVHPTVSDVLIAALQRSQWCLLALWFAAGQERWSWRCSGLLGGGCFLFSVFSFLLFPWPYFLASSTHWEAAEWEHYFRAAGPGDLLVKGPLLLAGVAGPLLLGRGWRVVRSWRRGEPAASDSRRRPWFQFGFQELAIWFAALSLGLFAFSRVSPYPGWFAELGHRVREIYRLPSGPAAYSVASAAVPLLTAWAAFWAASSPRPLGWRIAGLASAVIVLASGFEVWRQQLARNPQTPAVTSFWFAGSNEILISALVAVSLLSSLQLVRLFRTATPRHTTRADSNHAM